MWIQSLSRVKLSATAACLGILAASALADANFAPQSPEGFWTLSGGDGNIRDGNTLTVTGGGKDHNYWLSNPLPFKPGSIYVLGCAYRGERMARGGGYANPSSVFMNVDVPPATETWNTKSIAFLTPLKFDPEKACLKFGQWHAAGTVLFKNISCYEALPIYARKGDITLGEDESVSGNTYNFRPDRIWMCRRPLIEQSAYYNTNRWAFEPNSYMIYKHDVGSRSQLSGSIVISIGYYTAGALKIEASPDGVNYLPVGEFAKRGKESFELPKGIFPAKAVWVKLSAKPQGSFQIYGYSYESSIDGAPLEFQGTSVFAKKIEANPKFAIVDFNPGTMESGSKGELSLKLDNAAGATGGSQTKITFSNPSGTLGEFNAAMELKPGENLIKVPYETPRVEGSYDVKVESAGNRLEFSVFNPIIKSSSYGALLPNSSSDVALWTASSSWKVGRSRAVPTEQAKALRISAASNEAEATQLVLTPKKALKGLKLSVGPMKNGDSTFPASGIELLSVGYVNIKQPSDETACTGFWPDPLLPISAGLELEAGANSPIWIKATVPKSCKAGVYAGSLQLSADGGFHAAVPLEIQVFNFSLPDETSCITSIGLNYNNIFKYHRAAKPAQKKEIAEKYLAIFGSHRISPYNPTPLINPVPKWICGKDVPLDKFGVEVDWKEWTSEMDRLMAKYHFNSFVVKLPGLGFGGCDSFHYADIASYKDGSPEFNALFNSYGEKFERILEENRWGGRGYAYVYDEPFEGAFPFIQNSIKKLKSATPKIQRMITANVTEKLSGGIDIWCPTNNSFNPALAIDSAKRGERMWWYTCTSNKPPFINPSLIDHAGMESRSWLWQTWAYDVEGILLWESAYWNATSVYGKGMQNPYNDPMCWSYIGSAWGNGDGRLIYPPLSAFDGGTALVTDDPVTSMRLELLRDGLEDYECFALLKKLLKEKEGKTAQGKAAEFKKLLEIPDEIKSLTQFTKNPAGLESRRIEILKAIEELSTL